MNLIDVECTSVKDPALKKEFRLSVDGSTHYAAMETIAKHIREKEKDFFQESGNYYKVSYKPVTA